jgi:hypothetical protein
MRCNSKPYSMTPKVAVWKPAALAVLLSLAASPALASNATSDASATTASLAGGAIALDQDAADIRRLTERVVGLEQRVDQLHVADPPLAPSAAERERAAQEEEREAEFQQQVWTMP